MSILELIDKINNPNDIKKLDKKDYKKLAKEIREFLINNLSKTGGHVASNLGAVELTMALHLVLDLPKDKIVWDVGHQSYTHKILTGRKNEFSTLRQLDGMSGFPKSYESPCDSFNTGHSSTSISAALGLAKARDLRKSDEVIVAVIGDGALSGGMAFEALNNIASLKTNVIIILNDNKMSISENVGGMSKYLSNIRVGQAYNEFKGGVEKALLSIPKVGYGIAKTVKKSKDSIKQLFVPGMLFEDMGITYVGPIDGHNINQMVETFEDAISLKKPIIIHISTIKGKGYKKAEKFPAHFHGVDPFDIETGKPLVKKKIMTYTDIFSRKLTALGEKNEKVVAITAAMPDGTGLQRFKEEFPDRFFDVGIAEEHAVTFAAGMAKEGFKPVVAIYSSFLQRAYDQILHDVCIQNLPVIFAVDRSGLVGADGETHQGIFDISYLSSIPNMTIVAPKNRYELSRTLEYAINYNGPIAIKYPRGAAYYGLKDYQEQIKLGKSEVIVKGSDVAIFAVGQMVEEAYKAYEQLIKLGYNPEFINARFIKPIDEDLILECSKKFNLIVTIEENSISGSYGQMVSSYLMQNGYGEKVLNICIPDQYVEHGTVCELRKRLGIDDKSIVDKIVSAMK